MGRRPRIEYEGAVYHVIQRGNNREFVFEKDNDKQHLLNQVERYKQSLGLKLFGYVVMGNHYHLLLQTQVKPLHQIMHRINSEFGRYYNLKYQRSGHVFQGRYKAIIVQNERYLLAVLRYLHRNPVAGGMCRATADYRYSSDGHYRENQSGLVDIDFVLDSFVDNRLEAIKKYKEFMAEEDNADYDELEVLGDENFSLTLRTRTIAPVRKRLDEILIDTGVSFDDFKLIKTGSRRRHLTPYKKVYVVDALEQKYTFQEIAGNISLSATAAAKLAQS